MIESGRAIADPIQGKITHNFFRRPDLILTSATWFIKVGDGTSSSSTDGANNNNHRPVLIPVSDKDALKIEEHYQKAIKACSSLDENGIKSILNEEVLLSSDDDEETPDISKRTDAKTKEDDDDNKNDNESKEEDNKKPSSKEQLQKQQQKQQKQYRVMVTKVDNNKLMMKKSEMGWFGKSYDLQRGYGNYTVEDEEIELSLGPVQNVIFVIHGIGEAMFSRDDIAIDSICDRINQTRRLIQKRQVEEWKRNCTIAEQKKYVCVCVCQFFCVLFFAVNL